MEKFNLIEIASKCREITDVQQLANAIRRTLKSFTWGSRNWTVLQVVGRNMGLRFRVSGRHHKGYVILVVNGLDLFDIYFTNLKGEVKDIKNNIYLEDLIDTIDKKVEWIPQYGHR